jgi:phage shock protein PspC (stress-responsive transcriptional regulator)
LLGDFAWSLAVLLVSIVSVVLAVYHSTVFGICFWFAMMLILNTLRPE